MSRAQLEKIEREIQKKLQQENLRWHMVWRAKDVVVCKWKDKRDVLTISNAHTHHKLLPLIIALEKKNKSATLWEITTIQCLELIAVIRCYPTTQGKEKLWGSTKKQEYTSLKSSLPMHSTFAENFHRTRSFVI